MSAASRGRRARAPPFLDPPVYARHRPEATLLYQLVEQHYPAFREMRAEAGRPLPDYIEQEFDSYLKCGRLEGRRHDVAGRGPPGLATATRTMARRPIL